jgi:6-hydroxycyclohex-1-ene-1-carbonyl-CoA dehydrogenase
MSGTPAGQQTAFALVDFGSYLGVVGYTSEKIEVRFSNLMAYDATARGNWGCAPEKYPAALALVLEGKVALEPYIERHKLSELPELLGAVHRHTIRRRAVVTP